MTLFLWLIVSWQFENPHKPIGLYYGFSEERAEAEADFGCALWHESQNAKCRLLRATQDNSRYRRHKKRVFMTLFLWLIVSWQFENPHKPIGLYYGFSEERAEAEADFGCALWHESQNAKCRLLRATQDNSHYRRG